METYRRLRRSVFEMLDDTRPTFISRVITGFLTITIVASIAIVILSSMQEIRDHYLDTLLTIDYAILVVFSIEYVLRIWVCVEDPRYAGPIKGRLRYATSPMALIDLLAILPTLLMGMGVKLQSIRVARLLRLARALKLVRYMHAMQVIGKVIAAKKHQLVTSLLFVTFMLVISSTMMYEVESDIQPDAFSSIPATMWWSVATLTTVGYGDVYPVTPMGKILAAISAVLGIGLFAIPTGILASGFSEVALKEEEERELQLAIDHLESAGREEADRIAGAAPFAFCPHCGERLPA